MLCFALSRVDVFKLELHFPEFLSLHNSRLVWVIGDTLHTVWKVKIARAIWFLHSDNWCRPHTWSGVCWLMLLSWTATGHLQVPLDHSSSCCFSWAKCMFSCVIKSTPPPVGYSHHWSWRLGVRKGPIQVPACPLSSGLPLLSLTSQLSFLPGCLPCWPEAQ